MKKGIPILGVALVCIVLVFAAITMTDHTVQHLPETKGPQGSQNAGGNTGRSTNSDESAEGNPQSQDKGGGVLANATHLFGLPPTAAYRQSSDTPGQGAIDQINPVDYRAWKVFGTNVSGLEFSGLFQPNTEQTYTYFRGKGFNTVRIPFDWNELQPDLYGEFDATSKQYLDENIKWAGQHGLSVVLDAHNYGRRYIYRDGGFRDDFTSGQQHTFQLPYGDQDARAGTLTFRDFGRGIAGTAGNPVAPAGGYKVTVDAKIDSYEGSAWNEFYIDTCYSSEDNRYSFVMNPVLNQWSLRQTINGTTVTLASGSKTWTLGQYYAISFDVNQQAAGKLNISIDGTPLFAANSVNSNQALTHGKVAMFPAGVKATIKNFVFDIAGDTTSGGPIERRITESGLPVDAWKDFWTKMAYAYKDNPVVLGYDHNEPHDMPVPTTPNNYSAKAAAAHAVPVATASLIGQSMLDALRSAGDDKFVVVDLDHWANTHYFANQYGVDPEPWVQDTLSSSKVVYSGHYYFDSDHSGQYVSGSTPASDSEISADVEPFFQWCQSKKVVCYEGEFGVPNTTEWQPVFLHFMELMKQYNIWWTQWAGGDIYSSPTTLQPTNSFTADRLQMTTIQLFLNP